MSTSHTARAPQEVQENTNSAAAPRKGAAPPKKRNVALDVFRGICLSMMWLPLLSLGEVAKAHPNSGLLRFLAQQSDHAPWRGMTAFDFPQPAFCFVVGMALPYSVTGRRARGESLRSITTHAMRRAVILILLGIFLRSVGRPSTNFTFVDTLSQTGLAYPAIFLLCFASTPVVWAAIGIVLTGYWAAWAFYPRPGADFDWSAAKAPQGGYLEGFAQHWDKNVNLGTAFDQWFLNLFPQDPTFVVNPGGYTTLNFIPVIATMCFGLLCTRWFREFEGAAFQRRAITVGVGIILLGLTADRLGICPVVKRVWTPSFVLVSGGICMLVYALLVFIHERWEPRWFEFPYLVIGTNPLATYCMRGLFGAFVLAAIRRHVPGSWLNLFGSSYEPLVVGALAALVFWLILHWMYRNRVYIKI